MSSKNITYIAIICLLLIFSTQAYLVFDYFGTTRAALIRESDDILTQVFKEDLGRRENMYYYQTGKDTIDYTPYEEADSNAVVVVDVKNTDRENISRQIDLATNIYVSNIVPLNLNSLDSITVQILKSRNISSGFVINKINNRTGQTIESSKEKQASSVFAVPSQALQMDFENKEALQLVLLNPFGLILKRMSLMLLASFVFSVICLIAFRFLLKLMARQKQLLVFKNEFLSTIAHELKRPITSIIVNMDSLKMPDKNIMLHDLAVDNSIRSAMEMNDTIGMIVALAKSEEGLLKLKKQDIDLLELLNQLKFRFLSNAAKPVEIRIKTDLDFVHLNADKQLLEQCFANLIDNAVKYSDTAVEIIISVEEKEQYILVSVEDNGFGIAPDKLAVIFDKYSRIDTGQIKAGGFGIGLNYVKTIVETHKGKINVSSCQGKGSIFDVLLPA